MIDYSALKSLLRFETLVQLQQGQRQWVDEALEAHAFERNAHWSQSIAIGTRAFVTQFRTALGPSAHHRPLEEEHNGCVLQEAPAAYTLYFTE